jgi:carbamoylphosphate synthase large subunit
MRSIGLDVPGSASAKSLTQAVDIARTPGFPVIRPRTLGGIGGVSPTTSRSSDLAERHRASAPAPGAGRESVIGWKELARGDARRRRQFRVICLIEHRSDGCTPATASPSRRSYAQREQRCATRRG